MSPQLITLIAVTSIISLASFYLSPKARTIASFFKGHSDGDEPSAKIPGLWTLTFSQVTTWIFARSIMNAVILGYFYGIGGALAYAAYYLSFLTGAWIIRSLRFRHGYESVQAFLSDRFGIAGTTSYNFVVGVRLVSEIFANLLVIGLLFGVDGSAAYTASILIVGAVALGYSVMGGLNASLKTDVFQMVFFIAVLGILLCFVFATGSLDMSAVYASTPDVENPGWVLLAVAFLQVWSYPLHDPVMMDRGFIADRKTTLASFYHAGWISVLCILAFGLIGVWAGLEKLADENFTSSLGRLIGEWPLVLYNIALVISCMSTLDSTFSSTAKLTIVNMGLGRETIQNGRIAMIVFLIGGLLMVFFGSKDLFSAVAVSGTASMFLAPVIFFSLWMGRTDIPVWSYLTSFASAMIAATLYFTESSGYTDIVNPMTGLEHKYAKLLLLSAGTMLVGCGAFLLGMATSSTTKNQTTLSP